MRQMMFAEHQPLLPVALAERALELGEQQGFLEQLFLEPQRHCRSKAAEPARSEGEIGLDQPLELEERLFVEDDAVELRGRDARFAQAISDCVGREAGVVLAPREALLLRGRDDPAVLDKAGGAVVIPGRYAEDVHSRAQKSV